MSLDLNSTTLSEVNLYFMRTSLWPAFIYTTLLMLVGTFGNILVIVVYRRHFRHSVTRMFIFALAILDLGNCVITMPAELMILIQFTSFPSPLWCKASRYLTYTFNGTSAVILIVIALDRYYKVCRPTKVCITIKRARAVCIGGFLFTAICSLPALILYGDANLQLYVTSSGVQILPLAKTLPNDTRHRPDANVTKSPLHGAAAHNGYLFGDAQLNTGKSAPVLLLAGKFCLLSTEHMESAHALIFYISMFTTYTVMVVLVVFFYYKVAITMFRLTSKHSKMFTFYGHKDMATSASNSVMPVGEGNVFFNKQNSQEVVITVGCEQKRQNSAQGGLKGSKSDMQLRDSVPRKLSDKAFESLPDSTCSPALSETRSGKTECSQRDTCSSKDLYNLDDMAIGQSVEATCDGQDVSANACTALDADCRDAPNPVLIKDSPLSRSLGDIESGVKLTVSEFPGTKSRFTRSSQRKSAQKIPKIKVEEIVRDESGSPSPDHLHLAMTNSLLLRRIKSAENMDCLSLLHKLQVPEGRLRRAKLPPDGDLRDTRVLSKKSTTRSHVKGAGDISHSSMDIDVIGQDANDAGTSGMHGRTLTVTKGKRKLCVIPVTGLSSKAAIHVKENHDTLKRGKSLDANVAKDGMVSNNNLNTEDTRDGSSLDYSDQSLSINHCSADVLNLTVTIRPKSTLSCRASNSRSVNEKSSRDANPSREPSRQEVTVSTADILQERHRRTTLHPFRTSRMLFIISLVFVISFLPFFVIALTRSSKGSSFFTSLNPAEISLMSIFIRSSLISNALNPVVYGLLSTHFRRECTGLVCCLFKHWDKRNNSKN